MAKASRAYTTTETKIKPARPPSARSQQANAPKKADDQVTLAMIRPLIREKGVLWGRACLQRFGVERFGKLRPQHKAILFAELSASHDDAAGQP